MKGLLLSSVFILIITLQVNQGRIVHVHKHGRDTKECLLTGYIPTQSQPNRFCCSLEFIAHEMGNYARNITIILETGIHLKSRTVFENCDFLFIQGRKNSIYCGCNRRQDDVGLSFLHASNLILSNIRVTECCGTRNITTYTSGILIKECSNITIDGLHFNKNWFGSALALVNPFGYVNIQECIFFNNGHTKKARPGSSFAGGLHVQFSKKIFTMLAIKNCEFNANAAPLLNAETSKLAQWNGGNGLGGGIGILLLKNSSCITIHISNCTFQGNSAPWGGGLCVYLQTQTSNNKVFITNSTFMDNAATGGGGIQIRVGNIERNLNNTILSQDIFVRKNQARFEGGGIN